MTGKQDTNQPTATPESPELSSVNVMTRRRFLRGTVTVGVVSLCFGSYSYFWELHRPTVERKDISLKVLPGRLDGFRLVQLSDIHYGPYLGSAELAAVVETVNQLHPDIIVMTGDYVTVPLLGDKSRALRDAVACAQLLGGFRAPGGGVCSLGQSRLCCPRVGKRGPGIPWDNSASKSCPACRKGWCALMDSGNR